MFNLLNPANLVRQLASVPASSELSFQDCALARWDNEGGAPKAADRDNSLRGEEHPCPAPMTGGEPDIALMRQASSASDSRELRALDDLYHQSFWRVQN